MHRITPDHVYSIHHTATEWRCAMLPQTNTYAVIKLEPLITRSICSSLRCVSAAEHHTAEHYTKADRIKLRKHLSRSSLQLNTGQDFLKAPSLWVVALETERRCFSNIILESNVTPNIPRSSDSFSTVQPIVHGGDSGCIVRDLETIIGLVLLALNLISQRSHYSQAFPML